ncbi:MAG: aldehyde ferredoxin oxidoreductase N-terminal domain-containing protein, partial [Candidatus Bathyarchaeia archaeon]
MALSGWVGKILRINLSSGKVETGSSRKYAEKYIGGRGMAARIAWEEIPPNIDAYDPENRLIIITGPLTGTLAPTSGGRMTVCGVAPQAYPKPKYTRSSIGGDWGAELKYAGYDGLVVHGKADAPVHVWINDGKVEIRDAARLWGLDTYATQRMIASELGRDVKTLCIGPAGESLVRISIIQSGLENAAGQGGFGAVKGSKK